MYKSKYIPVLALSGALITGIPVLTWAQTNPGLTIFSGVDRDNVLDYRLDFGGKPGEIDRYKLRIPAKKMIPGAVRFTIRYPDYYDGKFDKDKMEIRYKDESLPVKTVIWDKESRIIEIELVEPIAEAKNIEIVMSNVVNPDFGGTYYFNAEIFSAQDLPIRRYVGTWILTIGRG